MSETVTDIRRLLAPDGSGMVAPKKKTSVPFDDSDPKKTILMIYIENSFGQSIYDLLDMSMKGADVARKLHVTRACVTKWRQRLGIVPSGGVS